ncbi:HNH endonuclease [Rhizobium daejeonense]|uniref:HNH endonuclease n=1 Tax=Rhizobium daejeonense TaxID=240521 RepID=A0A6M1RQN7_9HYPH|nr:HNH endonuclease [Rhizobium daejeonense]NGO63944.1 HNH endonuclease [Rhizobium daejeonense]
MKSRADSAAWQHLYKSIRWKRIRESQLAHEPLCRMCLEAEDVTVATICDHVIPHKGNIGLFYGGPFQSLCKYHHDSTKHKEEAGKVVVRYGADGWPL